MEDIQNTSGSSVEVDDCPPTPEHMPPGSQTPPPQRVTGRKKKQKRSRSLDGRSSPDPEHTCPICLSDIDNKSMTDTCLHKFCFTCLLEWSKVRAVCPLCKGKFTAILHNVISDTEYSKYELPPPLQSAESERSGAGFQDFLFSTRRFRYHSTMTQERVESRYRRHVLGLIRDPLRSGEIWRRRRGPGTSDFRREVYLADLWAQPLTDTRLRECSPEWYRANEAQTHRLVPWLNRELNALLSFNGHQNRQALLITQIIDWIKIYTIGSPELSTQLLPYLGTYTDHFQHEFLHFARSPYDLVGYDRNVTYDNRRLTTEVVSSDSDNDEPPRIPPVPGPSHDRDEYFVQEIRNRVQALAEARDLYDRIRRQGRDGSGLGVTNYPERPSRVAATGENDESRSEIRRVPRDDTQRSYRREVDRLWSASPRTDERDEREGQSRRKRRKPSKCNRQGVLSFSRGEMTGENGDASDENPLDLSVGDANDEYVEPVEVVDEAVSENQPSTSRGHSSGLGGSGVTRLVIPDSDDSDSDTSEEHLVVDDDNEDNPRDLVLKILDDIVSRVISNYDTDPRVIESETHVSEVLNPVAHSTFTEQALASFIAGSHPLLAQYQYMNELSAMSSAMMNFPPPQVNQDDDNSDLEVVDVVSAKPPRKPKDPEVVELSDSGEEEETQAPAQSADDDVILVISSDEEESHPPARKRKGSSSSSSSSSGSDDDLIVVKTEHNTIDPITKKQIVDPVRNKKCNHIYEKSTIYSMIDLARENSKPVKCPYMGCNERDFKKTDLVRDKTVLNHISEMNTQKEKEEMENKKKESEKKKNKGNESDHSITLDIDDDEEDEHNKSAEFEVSGIADPNLSESSSEETIFNTQSSTSPMTSSFNSVNNITVTTNTNTDERQVSVEKEKRKKKRTERLSYSEVSESSESDQSLQRKKETQIISNQTRRRTRKPSSRLNDSFVCSDNDESNESEEETRRYSRKKSKGRSPKKKLRIVGKKVTETWCIEKAGSKKRRKKTTDSEDEEASDEDDDQEHVPTSKGKSSHGKPSKNAHLSRGRPKRAKQVSYKEFEEDY